MNFFLHTSETREGMRGNPLTHLHDSDRQVKDLIGTSQFKDDDKEAIDVPFFDMEIILAATNNFSGENKLGQGGFGPVYKVIIISSTSLFIFNCYVRYIVGCPADQQLVKI